MKCIRRVVIHLPGPPPPIYIDRGISPSGHFDVCLTLTKSAIEQRSSPYFKLLITTSLSKIALWIV